MILEQGVDEEDLFIVREVPFSRSMKKSFEIGLKRDKKWTFCVDADVLLRKGSIKKMVQFAENQKKNVCEIQGLVLDKFFSGPREAGNHLYRTSMLDKVIDRIPTEGEDIRPETHALNRMAADGYPWEKVPYLVGIHDDEQYNFDIYRKSFVQAVKHLNYADLIVNHWKNNLENDYDFRVALTAFSDGIKNTDTVYINSEQNLYRELFNQAGFQEKDELVISHISIEDIEERIETWKIDENYYNYFPNSLGLHSSSDVLFRKLRSSIKNRGFLKTIRLSVSQTLIGMGKRLGRKVPE
jgi:hypothetical protein